MAMRKAQLWFILSLLVLTRLSFGDAAELSAAGEPPASEQREARERFRSLGFGMFVHWGIYSQLGDGEWVLNNHKIPLPGYEPLAASFRPERFRGEEWIELARGAGMRYLTVTAKHHDGFCLFDSKETD